MTQWDVQDARVLISTEQEKNYSADRLVIAAHGWSRELLAKGNIEPHPSFLESIYTKRAPIWQFEFPDGVIPAIGRSSLPGKPYLDVYYLPEYSEELEKVVMKVGLNSDKDRAQQYSSPNEIYLNPLLNQVNDAETLEVKRLVQEKFGIILGEPISRHVCCMTYSKTVAQEKFSLPVVGQFITKDSLVVPQVIGIFAGCGIGAKLSPAIGNIVRKGIETQWQGKEPQDKAIFEALSPGRFVRHEQSREMKQSFAEKLGHLKYGSRESVGLFG